jgi:hypothetical protein
MYRIWHPVEHRIACPSTIAGDLAQQPPAQRRSGQIDQTHKAQQDQDQGGRLAVLEEVKSRDDLEAQAAGPDDADGGGGAQVVLSAIDRDVGDPRHDLRPDGKAQHAETGDPLAAQRVARGWIDMLQDLAAELGEHADGMAGEREHARQRAEADCGDSGNFRDQGWDRAAGVQHLTHGRADLGQSQGCARRARRAPVRRPTRARFRRRSWRRFEQRLAPYPPVGEVICHRIGSEL